MGVPILRGGRVLGVLVVQNRAASATTPRTRSRRCRPSPWCWPSCSRAASWSTAPQDARRRQRRHGAADRLDGLRLNQGWPSARPCCTSPASRSPACSPTTPRPSSTGSTGRRPSCSTRSTTCSPRRPRGRRAARHPGSLPHVRPRPRLARAHRARRSQRPDRRGRRAEVQDETRARMARPPTRICASGCSTSRISPTGCSRHLTGKAASPRPARCRPTRHPRRPQPGCRPSCSTTTAPRLRGVVLEEGSRDRACHDRRARARHAGARPGRRRSWTASSRATRSSSTPTTATSSSGRATTCCRRFQAALEARDERRRGFEAAARPAGGDPRRRSGSSLHQRRPPHRPGAARRHRRRRRRPLPHRAPLHGAQPRFPDVAAQAALLPARARAGRRPAGDLPHPRCRRRQAAALLADAGRGEPGHGLAGDPA